MKIEYMILGLLILISISCESQVSSKKKESIVKVDSTYSHETIKIKKLDNFRLRKDSVFSYKEVKNIIKKTLLNIKNKDLDSVSKMFKTSLLNRIIPYWEGTPWSFEGHTSVPKKGEIACGYFVSTTLRDIGLNLNRYALAQQSPENEAKSLSITGNVIEIKSTVKSEKIKKIKKALKEGIHFIGFDSGHVGYILKEKDDLYLIHSNYLDGNGVGIEPVEDSEVFDSFDYYYLVELSTNKELLKYWINKTEIQIIK